jgi:hypothetical protein
MTSPPPWPSSSFASRRPSEQEAERPLLLEQLVDRLFEGAHVRQPRQAVTLREHLQPRDQLAVPLCIPADQRPRRREREQPDRRRDRDRVERRKCRVEHDGHRVQRSGSRTGESAEPSTADQRDQGDRDVEEVAEAETRRLHEHERGVDRDETREGEAQDQPHMRVDAVHATSRSSAERSAAYHSIE